MFLDLFEFSKTWLINRNRLKFSTHFHSLNLHMYVNSRASGNVEVISIF